MTYSTVLQNIQDAQQELGISVSTSAVGSSDAGALQMLAIMQRVGQSLSTESDWQCLAKDYRFQTVVGQFTGSVISSNQISVESSIFPTPPGIGLISSITAITPEFMITGPGIQADTFISPATDPSILNINLPATQLTTSKTYTIGQAKYPMPSDFRRMIDKTNFNKSNRWANLGPKSPQEWQWLKSSYITGGPRVRFRIMGNEIVFWPMPTVNNLVMGFEYQSNAWVLKADGTPQTRYLSDTDTCVFPDALMVLAAKAGYQDAKGLDSSASAALFQRELSKFKGVESGADTLSLAPQVSSMLINLSNLPDSGFGQ
jgi:hypothetical protein